METFSQRRSFERGVFPLAHLTTGNESSALSAHTRLKPVQSAAADR